MDASCDGDMGSLQLRVPNGMAHRLAASVTEIHQCCNGGEPLTSRWYASPSEPQAWPSASDPGHVAEDPTLHGCWVRNPFLLSWGLQGARQQSPYAHIVRQTSYKAFEKTHGSLVQSGPWSSSPDECSSSSCALAASSLEIEVGSSRLSSISMKFQVGWCWCGGTCGEGEWLEPQQSG